MISMWVFFATAFDGSFLRSLRSIFSEHLFVGQVQIQLGFRFALWTFRNRTWMSSVSLERFKGSSAFLHKESPLSKKKALPQGKDDKYRGTTNLPPDQCRGHFPITPGRGNHSISVAAPLTDTFAVFRPPCFTTPWLSLDFPTGTPSGHRFDDSYSNGLCSNRNVFEM